MPPGAAYNWLCAAHSFTDILTKAAQIRAVQLERKAAPLLNSKRGNITRRRRLEDEVPSSAITSAYVSQDVPTSLQPLPRNVGKLHEPNSQPTESSVASVREPMQPSLVIPEPLDSPMVEHPVTAVLTTQASALAQQVSDNDETPSVGIPNIIGTFDEVYTAHTAPISPEAVPSDVEVLPTRKLQSSKVPASRIGRLFHYGGMLIQSILTGYATNDDSRSGCFIGIWCRL